MKDKGTQTIYDKYIHGAKVENIVLRHSQLSSATKIFTWQYVHECDTKFRDKN